MIEFNEGDFEVWKEFIFQHSWPPWYDDVSLMEWRAESADIVKWCTALFRNSLPLLNDYPLENLDAGFWFIPSAWGFCGVTLDPQVPLHAREEMIRSIASLYEGIFRHLNDLQDSAGMFLEGYFTYAAWEDRGIHRESDILPALDALLTRMESMNVHHAAYAASLGRVHYCSILK